MSISELMRKLNICLSSGEVKIQWATGEIADATAVRIESLTILSGDDPPKKIQDTFVLICSSPIEVQQ